MKKMFCLLLITVLVLPACTKVVPEESVGTETSQISVVTGFYPIYFFTQKIGGDKASITNLTPAGTEPHDYEPTAQDILKIENSELLILNGGGLEAWEDNIKQNLSSKKTVIIVAGEGLTTQQIMEDGEKDPHVWLSPKLAKEMADKIADGFIQVDPTNKEYYEANVSTLKSELDDLDQKFSLGLKNCEEKNIITSHSAFGYLASTYGLNQVPITGLSPEAEPSPQELAEVVKFVKANDIKYIFFESLISPKLSETIASEVGAETLVLNPLEGLTDEELAEGKDYFSEMENNLANLKIALQCQ